MTRFPSINEQMDIIRSGAEEIIPEEDLVKRLESSAAKGIPLRVKLGCDPSRPDLHLGHAVVLRKLRQFQDLGHEAILIVGDFTGMIGDPSGKNKTRPPLTLEATRVNGQSYFEQASKVLEQNHVTIKYNSEWLAAMTFEDVIRLSSKYTVARMLERDEFEKRFDNQEAISIHEFLYPLAQAMDSVAIKADVELGGTDQKFNLLVGREIQREYGVPPQVILTMPLLVGTDGVEKMSKSLNNYIAFNDTSEDMYGKVLSIPDTLISRYFRLVTSLSADELQEIDRSLADPATNPRDLKRLLARTVVADFYTPEAASAAEEHFDRVFKEKLAPEEMDEYILPASETETVLDVIVNAGLVSSKGDGRRMVLQSAVSIDNVKVTDPFQTFTGGTSWVVKVGKRRFLKVLRSS